MLACFLELPSISNLFMDLFSSPFDFVWFFLQASEEYARSARCHVININLWLTVF